MLADVFSLLADAGASAEKVLLLLLLRGVRCLEPPTAMIWLFVSARGEGAGMEVLVSLAVRLFLLMGIGAKIARSIGVGVELADCRGSSHVVVAEVRASEPEGDCTATNVREEVSKPQMNASYLAWRVV